MSWVINEASGLTGKRENRGFRLEKTLRATMGMTPSALRGCWPALGSLFLTMSPGRCSHMARSGGETSPDNAPRLHTQDFPRDRSSGDAVATAVSSIWAINASAWICSRGALHQAHRTLQPLPACHCSARLAITQGCDVSTAWSVTGGRSLQPEGLVSGEVVRLLELWSDRTICPGDMS